MPNLESITCRLVEAKVEFVLCGGLAAFLQGSSILTRDVDVVCDFGHENIRRLFEAVKDLHPYHRMKHGECLKWSEPIEMAGFTMLTLTLEGILLAKRAMGRPRDLQAVFELEAVRERKNNPL